MPKFFNKCSRRPHNCKKKKTSWKGRQQPNTAKCTKMKNARTKRAKIPFLSLNLSKFFLHSGLLKFAYDLQCTPWLGRPNFVKR